jgi:uncharacterized protein (TIGR03663 family)
MGMSQRLSIRWDNKFWLYLFLFLVALGMRLWDLEARPYHYDESLHAYYSYQLFIGQGYVHDPMMHGPFKFLSTAAIFHIFGDSDFTARLLPAFMGALLVLLPYLLRKQLGGKGAFLTSVFLAVSPSFLYFSRFIRDDIFMVFWVLLLVTAIWRYWEEEKEGYLFFGVFALAMGFITMETTMLFLPIFLLFILFFTWREFLQALRKGIDFSSLSPPAAMFLVLLSLALPFYAAGAGLFQGLLGVTLISHTAPEGLPAGTGIVVAAGISIFLFSLSVFLGLRWSPRRWLLSALLFYGICILYFTTFFQNMLGLGTGFWGSLGYWLVQHGRDRLSQPWFYYPILLSIYEFLPLILAGAGFVYYLRRRQRFTTFLLYWAAAALIMFTFVGEKAPWLILHVALPLILLAGRFAGELWERLKGWPLAAGAVVFLLLFGFWVRASFQASFARSDEPPQMLVYAQGSWDILKVKEELEVLSWHKEFRLLVEPEVSWPWTWYLRHNDNVIYSLSGVTVGDAVLARPAQADALKLPQQEYLEERFTLLVWFREDYRSWTVRDLPQVATWWWRYFSRRQVLPYWTSEGVALLPRL